MITYRIIVHIEGLLDISVFVISFDLTSMCWSHGFCREDGIPDPPTGDTYPWSNAPAPLLTLLCRTYHLTLR